MIYEKNMWTGQDGKLITVMYVNIYEFCINVPMFILFSDDYFSYTSTRTFCIGQLESHDILCFLPILFPVVYLFFDVTLFMGPGFHIR